MKACGLCLTMQPKVKYDGAGMPICMGCILKALNDADEQLIVEAVTIAIANEAWGTVEWLNTRLRW